MVEPILEGLVTIKLVSTGTCPLLDKDLWYYPGLGKMEHVVLGQLLL